MGISARGIKITSPFLRALAYKIFECVDSVAF
jgi:hypothetical protein